ncbi:hypothetical protein L0B53_08245 [Vibrio sp. SS-MA-C1-2]|uniref:hypothetical protein n=1 Tax=Vibrio sp. SS-MA-C1-2 TaxID=2908646 RepID=UPI001F20E0F4|nr:hypothetical protein [Vibrio sp. SS-MA-C1-2]UJF19503.1 hypothetical protein L0B53_08245 [Vibrio sp. SS-MA-C1-2]
MDNSSNVIDQRIIKEFSQSPKVNQKIKDVSNALGSEQTLSLADLKTHPVNVFYFSKLDKYNPDVWPTILDGIRSGEGRLYVFVIDQKTKISGTFEKPRNFQEGIAELNKVLPVGIRLDTGSTADYTRPFGVMSKEYSAYTAHVNPNKFSHYSIGSTRYFFTDRVPKLNMVFQTTQNALLSIWGFDEMRFYNSTTTKVEQGACVMLLNFPELMGAAYEFPNSGDDAGRGIIRRILPLMFGSDIKASENGCYTPAPHVDAKPDRYNNVDNPISGFVFPYYSTGDSPVPEHDISVATLMANDSKINFNPDSGSANAAKHSGELFITTLGKDHLDAGTGQAGIESSTTKITTIKGGELKITRKEFTESNNASGFKNLSKIETITYTPPIAHNDEDEFYYRVCASNTNTADNVKNTDILCSITLALLYVGEAPPLPAATITLDGYVFNDHAFNDNSSATPHNGLKETGEEGLANRVVTLTNTDNATETLSAVTDGRGRFSYPLPNEWKTKNITLTVEPTAGWQAISESIDGSSTQDSSGNEGVNTTDSQFSGLLGEQTQFLFGQIKKPVLTQDHKRSIAANEGTQYFAHQLQLYSPSTLKIMVEEQNRAWPIKIYQDNNCNGELEAGDTKITADITTTQPEQTFCIVTEVTPQFSASGVDADFYYYLDVEVKPQDVGTSHGVTFYLSNQDILSLTNFGKLTLEKTVRNMSEEGSVESKNNTAKSGDTLEYKLYFSNESEHPISNVVLLDYVPEFSQLVGGSLPVKHNCGLSKTIECELKQPLGAENNTGYQGKIRWVLPEPLNPTDRGVVSFQIKVDD